MLEKEQKQHIIHRQELQETGWATLKRYQLDDTTLEIVS